ncbi:MAG: hypothetical protein AB1540_17655, partial [Bdellovibrionota bacterium]
MNLFALTDISAARVIRFPLTQELQQQIEELLQYQEREFMSGIHEMHNFDGRYRPESGELLIINDFIDVDGVLDAVRNPLAVEQFNPQQHLLGRIKAIFSGYEEQGVIRALIQLFEPRRVIANKGFAIFFSGNTFQKLDDIGLALDNKLLAILEGNVIRFQSFHYLRRVFELDDYFKAATDSDVLAFASHPRVSVADRQAFLGSANALIRSKIALIQQSGILDRHTDLRPVIRTVAKLSPPWYNHPRRTHDGTQAAHGRADHFRTET